LFAACIAALSAALPLPALGQSRVETLDDSRGAVVFDAELLGALCLLLLLFVLVHHDAEALGTLGALAGLHLCVRLGEVSREVGLGGCWFLCLLSFRRGRHFCCRGILGGPCGRCGRGGGLRLLCSWCRSRLCRRGWLGGLGCWCSCGSWIVIIPIDLVVGGCLGSFLLSAFGFRSCVW
jgi:hypothetical protein